MSYENGTDLDLSRARDGDDILALREDPGQSDLSWRCIVFLRYSVQTVDQVKNVREVLLRVPEAWRELFSWMRSRRLRKERTWG